MSLLKTILITIIFGYPVIFTSIHLYKVLQEDMGQYKKDMKCIHVLVSQGIERKDIISKDGVCVVDEDIYYKSINN